MAIFKSVFSEDNWHEVLFDDSKLEGHSFPFNDWMPDPNNPYFKRIKLNRDIHFQWEEYCEKHHDRSEIDTDLDIRFGINLAHIILHNPDLLSISTYPSYNKLVSAAQDYAVETYNRKGLLFYVEIAAAIAGPDDWKRTLEEIAIHNVMIVGRYGYDLNINLTLTSPDFEELKEEAAFFFAMKARQIDLMRIDDFLDYQLGGSFSGDEQRLSRFLKLLCKKYGSPNVTHGFDTLLKKEWVDSILGWVELPKTQVGKTQSRQVESQEAEEKAVLVGYIDNSLGKCFNFSDHNLEAIKRLLNPFFDETDQLRLEKLLKGGAVSTKLFFRAECSIICTFFRMLKEKKVIQGTKEDLGNWMLNNFTYLNQKTKESTSLSPNTVYDSLTKDARAAHKRIEFEVLKGEIQITRN